MLSFALTVLLDGVSYGMILFLISVGLTVTMGLMRVVNLAHGAFAMIGGYVAAYLTQQGGNFYLAVLGGAAVAAALGAIAEMTIYRPLYRKGELSQVLLTVGIVFVATGAITAIFGAFPYPVVFPDYLTRPVDIGFREYPAYRLFLIAVGAAIAAVLWLVLDGFDLRREAARRRRQLQHGARRRNRRESAVHWHLYHWLRAGWARRRDRRRHPFARAGLCVEIHRLVPGGRDRRWRGKFRGLVRCRDGARDHRHHWANTSCPRRRPIFSMRPSSRCCCGDRAACCRRNRSHDAAAAAVLAAFGHALPWAIAIAYFYLAPYDLSFGTQVMIWILFAMSLDLALGYAGILTLGHAGFFGLGAYAAGLFAIHVSPDPILGHLAAVALAAVFGAITGAMILHTSGVTFLMLTLAIVSVLSRIRQSGARPDRR